MQTRIVIHTHVEDDSMTATLPFTGKPSLAGAEARTFRRCRDLFRAIPEGPARDRVIANLMYAFCEQDSQPPGGDE